MSGRHRELGYSVLAHGTRARGIQFAHHSWAWLSIEGSRRPRGRRLSSLGAGHAELSFETSRSHVFHTKSLHLAHHVKKAARCISDHPTEHSYVISAHRILDFAEISKHKIANTFFLEYYGGNRSKRPLGLGAARYTGVTTPVVP